MSRRHGDDAVLVLVALFFWLVAGVASTAFTVWVVVTTLRLLGVLPL